ncbi:MAG: hypothetical protein P8Q90_04850, partial [Candidatus Thalassarchaeaceae archaeon]|nr:hypothetical protein [Candidatus Thalassarchaeaceae archaeon]
ESEHRGEQLGVPEVETPEDTDTPEIGGPNLAEAAASPEQDDVISEGTEAVLEETTESGDSASEWTDDQLLGAGWTQEQIDSMRNG